MNITGTNKHYLFIDILNFFVVEVTVEKLTLSSKQELNVIIHHCAWMCVCVCKNVSVCIYTYIYKGEDIKMLIDSVFSGNHEHSRA